MSGPREGFEYSLKISHSPHRSTVPFVLTLEVGAGGWDGHVWKGNGYNVPEATVNLAKAVDGDADAPQEARTLVGMILTSVMAFASPGAEA